MDYSTTLIFLVIFGLIGFITEKIWGHNPYKTYSDIGAMILMFSIIFFFLPAIINPENALTQIEKLPIFLTKILPGMIIGDIAGTMIAKITGEKR